MQVKELGHVVITVSNLERSARFYRDVLGLKEVGRIGDRGMFFAGGEGRTHHELLIQAVPDGEPIPSAPHIGLSHIAFKIGTTDEELKEAHQKLKEAEVEITNVTDHGVTHSIYMKDPDGHRIEVFIDVQPESWRTDPTKSVGQGGKPLALSL